MRILVTGGRGTLSRGLLAVVRLSGHAVRIMSRRPPPPSSPGLEFVRADLATGEGLDDALDGVDAIIHAATDPAHAEAVDVQGTEQLARAAQGAGVSHLVYVSIVGVDRIPYPYYKCKLAAEGIVAAGGVPWSILRATQFHSFVDFLLTRVSRVPLVMPLPLGFKVQSVDVSDVAARLVRAAEQGPAGRLPDLGGPVALSLREAAAVWRRSRGVMKLVLPLPVPGKMAAAFRAGANLVPSGYHGRQTWAEWLAANPVEA